MSDAEFVDEAGELLSRIERLHGNERIAAACRGSANPAALRWLVEALELGPGRIVADLGAGLGGPAEWIRSVAGCRVVAADPSPTAVAGARRLFGLDSVQSTAASAPFVDGTFDAVLLLGVLSVVDARAAVLREASRIGGSVGVLDYCSASSETSCVGGSRFPTPTDVTAELSSMWGQVRSVRIDEPTPPSWSRAADRAHAGIPTPRSERDVIEAIEAGRLVAHAFVGR